jgi:hypothetical protein
MVTRLADLLSYHFLMPDIFNAESVFEHPVIADLNLYPDDVEMLFAMRDKIQSIVEAMS